jgi:lysophospholipase L1-like esterase
MKKWLLTYLFSTLLCIQLIAQENSHSGLPNLPFIRYDKNKITFFDDSSRFERFFTKLDRLINEGTGQVNIVHIGGSHVQADIHSGRLRLKLHSMFPGIKGARGFVFPFRMAKTNNPANYNVDYTGSWSVCKNIQSAFCNLGLSGMSVTTTDTNTTLIINPNIQNNGYYDFNRIRIFHTTDSTSFSVIYENSDNVESAIDNPKDGYTEFRLKKHEDTLRFRFQKSAATQKSMTIYGIQFLNDDPGISYNSIGVNGASVPSYLKCVLFTDHLRAVKPDLIILSIGVNDAHGSNFSKESFEANYEKLLAMIFRAAPETAILFTTNNDTYFRRKYVNPNAMDVKNTMEKLAARYGLAVWDLFTIMGGYSSMSLWEKEGLAASDRIHFTRSGYTLIGDLMFEALYKAYLNHLKSLRK